MNKELKQAIERKILNVIEYANYGDSRLSNDTPLSELILLRENKVKINYDTVECNGVVVANIKRKQANQKRNGMYRHLKPVISYI